MFVKSSTLLSRKYPHRKERKDENKKGRRKTFNGKAINNGHKCQNFDTLQPSTEIIFIHILHHT
jgi:hypothetical protein